MTTTLRFSPRGHYPLPAAHTGSTCAHRMSAGGSAVATADEEPAASHAAAGRHRAIELRRAAHSSARHGGSDGATAGFDAGTPAGQPPADPIAEEEEPHAAPPSYPVGLAEAAAHTTRRRPGSGSGWRPRDVAASANASARPGRHTPVGRVGRMPAYRDRAGLQPGRETGNTAMWGYAWLGCAFAGRRVRRGSGDPATAVRMNMVAPFSWMSRFRHG
jgi:hypothetical protein